MELSRATIKTYSDLYFSVIGPRTHCNIAVHCISDVNKLLVEKDKGSINDGVQHIL